MVLLILRHLDSMIVLTDFDLNLHLPIDISLPSALLTPPLLPRDLILNKPCVHKINYLMNTLDPAREVIHASPKGD